MGGGILLPQLHAGQFLVRPAVMVMLFLAFFAMPPGRLSLEPAHLKILAVGPLLALALFGAILPFDRSLAVAAALVALTPSATASPVVTALLGGNAGWVGVPVLLTNLVYPLLVALVLPAALGQGGRFDASAPLSTLVTLAVPAVLAWSGRRWLPATARAAILARRHWSFFLWLAVLSVATAGASHFLRSHPSGGVAALRMGALSLSLCAFLFLLGRRLGGSTRVLEASQALGQKNTMFALWFAMAHLSPVISLAPATYVLWHNLWNAWQLQKARRTLGEIED